MPSSLLFAVNTEGRVFGLSTNGTKWREFPYLGIDFKIISAVPNFLWAVGGDRQIYVHVHGLDIPIRVTEECYENQRWFPIEGFTNRLLPTDRWQFSSEDGTVDRAKEKIRVPSMAWQWEGDWHLETVMDGQQLDHDGWTYSVDFPGTYYNTKQWSSCVRRRKWTRSRRYAAMNSWCAVSPLHKDPTQEPFIDVSVGGQLMSEFTQGELQVWAVTAQGRVMWRKGVSNKSPEGVRWVAVNFPGYEFKYITCGAAGLVWGILWTGKALVRTGISATVPMGLDWVEVDLPEEDLSISQIGIGYNAVWVVTSDKRVWFRKGVRGMSCGSVELAKGTGWVEMVGNMSMISVTPEDQVFAVGIDDRSLYFRVGVTAAELTGKRWKCLSSTVQLSRGSSNSSSRSSLQFRQHRSTLSLENTGIVEKCEWEESSRSAPTSLKMQQVWNPIPFRPSSLPASEGSVEEPSLINGVENMGIEKPQRKLTAWSPIRSVGSVLGLEVNPDTDPAADWDGIVCPERETTCEPGWQQADTLWTRVEAGALAINPLHLPNWFFECNPIHGFEKTSWRNQILSKLKDKNSNVSKSYSDIEAAVEISSSTKSVECRYLLAGEVNHVFRECILELEWSGNSSVSIDVASLSILSLDKSSTICQLSLNEISCVLSCSEPGSPRIALHTVDSVEKKKVPYRLQFSAENDHEEWMAYLSFLHSRIGGLEDTPSVDSMWVTTHLGDVYVFDQKNLKKNQSSGGLYSKELNCHNCLGTGRWCHVLENGLPLDSSLIITGFISKNLQRFAINLNLDEETQTALHFNPRFDQNAIIRNSMENGLWQKEERDGTMTLTQGSDFEIEILSQRACFKILVNKKVFTYFQHRFSPHRITQICVNDDVQLHQVIYNCKEVIIPLHEMVWKQVGGHLRTVETCSAGVTWGISFDNTPYVYSGGWGGAFLGCLQKSNVGIFSMVDYCCCNVYENQRWNPLTGFTPRGLPTDRFMWSDSTGLQKRSKETTKLLSKHWQWCTEWMVDNSTPGGVDADGWQYAVDFPASYHPKKNLTDYVRRRRWVRTCKLSTSGPWVEVGNTKIIDISLQDSTSLETTCVWAVSSKGDALFRHAVSKSNPMGDKWEHVPCDQPLVSISCGCGNQVWAVASSGSSMWRFGITTSNPKGDAWELVESPKGTVIKKLSIGRWAVWALDNNGKVYVRSEVTPVFPEGTHWQPITQPDFETFKDISSSGDEVWAISSSGSICRRLAVSCDDPNGTSWIQGMSVSDLILVSSRAQRRFGVYQHSELLF